jgi:ABC-type oligopeptide transport system substrate-binding subunit/DNA-binding SARP family transcriptional activator
MSDRDTLGRHVAAGGPLRMPVGPAAMADDVHRLKIVMFGAPAVLLAGKHVRLPRRQTRALLYRLAAQATPVSREVLSFLFWPDVPETTARRNLTRLLVYLRKYLPGAVLLERESVALNPERVESEAVTFERLIGTAEGGSLQRALVLYRGPFLSGFSLPHAPEFESWALREQQRFERRYMETMSALIETHSAQGRYKEAVTLAERYLDTDDLAEEMHRRLMELYALAGDRPAALRHYEHCVVLLQRELGVPPLPETQAVYQAILRDELPARRRSAAAPAPVLASPPDSPLIGRDEAWQVLEQLLAGARGGRGGAVLLAGEAGIGKTRLMHEFAAGQAGQALLLAGAGYPGAQATPFLPLVEALRPHLSSERLLDRVAPIWLAEASTLLPELQRKFPDLPTPAPTTPDQVRARMFEALRQIVIGLARPDEPPLLFCLDDLHWADRSTLEWLSHLARHVRDAPILLIGTYRSTEEDVVSDLRRSSRRTGALVELDLRPLTESEVMDLLHHLAPEREADQALARRMHTLTGGNPFYLVEIVRMLHDAEQASDVPLPGSVLETVRARVARLPGEARQVLGAAAILGDGFDFELLQETAGRSELETVRGLDELVARALLTDDSEGNGYRFRHDLIRLVVSKDLSVRRRQLLHRRAARALEASLARRPREEWPVGRLGLLYAGAGEAADAVPYLLEAGDRARVLYAHDEAVAYYEEALPLVEQLGDEQLVARTYIKLGLTYHDAFDFAKAGEKYDRGVAAWWRAGWTVANAPAPHPLRLPWDPAMLLDPALASETASTVVAQQLFASPAELSPELDIVPDLAATWEVRDGGRTYFLHLRHDLQWSDGRPLVAADFEYAWKRLLSPATGSILAPFLHALKGAREFHRGETRDADRVGVRAVDDRTLIVELEEPVSYFPQILADLAACAVPRHAVEKHGEGWTDPERLVSCGPFRLASAGSDGFLELVRDSGYHGRFSGNLQRVELHGGVQPDRLLDMYEADQLDALFFHAIPSRDAANWARERYAKEYVSVPMLTTFHLRFNPGRPPFHDVRVRQALAMALDKHALANRIDRSFRSPASGGFVPPGMPGHAPDIGLPFDPDQARHLLAVAGYPGGRGMPEVDAWYEGGSSAVLQWLQAQWREVLGIEVAWRLVDWRNRFDTGPDGPPLVYTLWAADYPDPDSFLRMGLITWGLLAAQEDLAGMVDKARLVGSQAERMALYRQADQALMAGATLVPLLYGRLHLLVKPWVKRYPISPMSRYFWKDVIIQPH